jgi:hypothetical protein
LTATSGTTGPSGHEHFDWQSIDIRVYHRQAGEETWGYFATSEKATEHLYQMEDDHSFSLFNGNASTFIAWIPTG